MNQTYVNLIYVNQYIGPHQKILHKLGSYKEDSLVI
jgi:hypothetical protein